MKIKKPKLFAPGKRSIYVILLVIFFFLKFFIINTKYFLWLLYRYYDHLVKSFIEYLLYYILFSIFIFITK